MADLRSHVAVGYAVLERPPKVATHVVVGYALYRRPEAAQAHVAVGYSLEFPIIYSVGDTVIALPGDWLHDPSAFEYCWLRDGELVPEEFGPSRMLLEPDEGAMIAVQIRATNPFGSSVTRSEEVGPVLPGEVPAPTGYSVDFSEQPLVFINYGALEHQLSSNGRYGLILSEVPEAADAEVLALTVTEEAETRIGVMARASGSAGSETCITCYQGRASHRLQFAEYDSGAFTVLANEGPDTAGGRRIWIRLRVEGETARVRWWYVGAQEPEGWVFEEAAAVTGAGRVGVFAFDAGARAYCEYLSAGIDGAAAPDPGDDLAGDQYRVTFAEAADIERFDEWWNTSAATLAYAVHGDAPRVPLRGWTALWEHEGNLDRSGAFMRLFSGGSSNRRAFAFTEAGRIGDVELYCEARPRGLSTANHTRLYARLDDIAGAGWAVFVEMQDDDTAAIQKYVDGSTTGLDEIAFAVPEDQWCGMRMRIEGGEVRASIWPLSDPEPANWMLMSSDAGDVPAGWPGVGCFGRSGEPDFRKFKVKLLEAP